MVEPSSQSASAIPSGPGGLEKPPRAWNSSPRGLRCPPSENDSPESRNVSTGPRAP